MCKSGLDETSEILEDESSNAKSRNFFITSFSSIANPESIKIFGLDD